jgi:SAM-dependent methyltransferase
MWADQALSKVLGMMKPGSDVLDWGCGVNPPHKEAFEKAGHNWVGFDTQTGWQGRADNPGSMMRSIKKPFDVVWCSHVLEHCYNPVKMLADFLKWLVPGEGILAVTVPPLKHEIVGGHINLYNAGLLLYHLVMAGYDCYQAKVKTYGYNISVIVKAPKRTIVPGDVGLTHDAGDIEKLAEFFPKVANITEAVDKSVFIRVYEGFDGRIDELIWE